MKACYTISITTVVLMVAFAASASALEPKLNLRRAVHAESGAAEPAVPRDASGHKPVYSLPRAAVPIDGPADRIDPSGPPARANTCPADNVGTLTDGDTITGSTIGSTDDFVAGCGSVDGGQDEIFEFKIDLPGEWTFDTCTVQACWDTTLEIREETGNGCPGDFVACDDDGCNVCVFESAVSAFLVPASTYYLIVDGWSSFAYGDFTITTTLIQPDCEDAFCDDGLFCNGVETCDLVSGVCNPGTPPCPPPESCDESNQICNPPATATLTVGSNPTGVGITVTPNDVNGDGNGTTQFTRVYTVGTDVCLTAPMMQGTKMFLRWELDGEQLPFGKTKATITMDEDHSVEAIYQCLEDDFDKTLDCAIKMIMDCFAECEPAQVENKDNGPSGKQIVKCLKLLTDAAHDNINRKCIGAIGQASGDMTANCNDKDLIKLNKIRFPEDMNKCDENFALLLNTLYHEATHNHQDWSCFRDRRFSRRVNNNFTKRCEARIELAAYINDKKVSGDIIDGIEEILDSRDLMIEDTFLLDAWFLPFTNCKTQELKDMLKRIKPDHAGVCAQIPVWTRNYNLAAFRSSGPQISYTLAESLYATSYPQVQREDFQTVINMADIQTSILVQTLVSPDPPTSEFLDTGIDRVLDLAVIRNVDSKEVLLVLGTTRAYEGGGAASGVIRAYTDDDNDGFFNALPSLELVVGDTDLQAASNLTEDTQTGDLYVYDGIRRTLRLFMDTNGDLIPDTLTGPSIIASDPLTMVEMAVCEFEADRIVARRRFGDVAQGNVDIVLITDTDSDGFYETLQRGEPSQLDLRPPTACTRPFIGNTTVGFFGTQNHTLRVDEVTSAGAFIQTIGSGVVPADSNEVFISFLPLTLSDGMFLLVTDTDTDLATGPFPTIPPAPVLYGADMTTGPLAGGTAVTYAGENLPTIATAEFGGVAGNIISQDDSSIIVESPASPIDQEVPVVFLPVGGGDPLEGTRFHYQAPIPAQPVADAGPQQIVTLGAGGSVNVTLDGSGSLPGGSSITEYVWTGDFVGGIAIGTAPVVTFTALGLHSVVLQVTDDERWSIPASTIIDVGIGADSPISAGAPHNILKNRYISIDPRGAGGVNVGKDFDIKVTLISSLVIGQLGNGPWWAGPPDAKCLSVVVPTQPGVPTNWDACPTLHLTGCPIIPTSFYDIVAVTGGTDSDPPLAAATQAKPGVKWHGDCVGFFDGAVWTPPNGTTSIDDAVAAIKTFQDPNAFNATHVSVTDVVPNLNGTQINLVVNINDVFSIILGFQGQEYPGPDLTQCP